MKASTIIEMAYQESAVLGIGGLPNDQEYTFALSRLNSFISALFGTHISTNLTDFSIPPSLRDNPQPDTTSQYNTPKIDLFNIPQNSRMVVGSTVLPVTLYLPENPHDGARFGIAIALQDADLTIDANGRNIGGIPSLRITPLDGFSKGEWFYRADTANWTKIKDMGLDDEPILPPVFDDLLVCWLAIRLSAITGTEPRSGTMMSYKDLLTYMKQRYITVQNTSYGNEMFNTIQTNNREYVTDDISSNGPIF